MAQKFKKEELLKEKARKTSVKEASAYSFMDGFGMRYITPYAVALGLKNAYIGLLTSFPSLLASFSQIFTARLMEKHSRRKIVFLGVLFQALMWLGLIAIGVYHYYFNASQQITSNSLVIVYTLLVLFGSLAGPAWTSWMKDIVKEKERGKYFSRRNKIAGTISLMGMLIAGFILDYFKQTKIFYAFIILFTIAFLGRFVSAMFFTKQYEPKLKLERGYYFSFWQFVKKMPYNNFGRFVIFYALIMFTTSVASPFFAVFLLKDMNIMNIQYGYIFFTLISMGGSVASLLIMQKWGKFTDKFGNMRVIKFTSYLIPLVPLLYFISFFIFKMFGYTAFIIFIIIEELLSGAIWAGFNLAAANFIYDAVTRERIALCVTYQGMISGLAIFLGATIGGIIASFDFNLIGLTPLLFLFLISIFLRLAVPVFFNSKINEVREVEEPDMEEIKKDLIFPRIPLMETIQSKLFKPRPN